MSATFPIWRSMLFVPAHVPKFVDAAHTRSADAYLLDLEDSVPLAQKAEARAALPSAVAKVSQSGATALVRINTDDALTPDDVNAAVIPGVRALMVPKVESAAQVQKLDARITELERERGIAPGQILLIAQIEHVRALPQLDEIAGSSPRVMGLILGSEDFSVSAGAEPTPETLYGPNQQLVFACRRAGILPFGFPGSISVFRDLDLFRQLITRAREMGFVGSYAIHPNQVQVMNELFAPPTADVAHARELLAAYEEAEAQGRGALEFRGRMVDMPVVLRARELLRRAEAIHTGD
ncbi:MAG: HpcH/HpaI aldolase/citrate lyase family protein [Panacagrimonas sp.]